MSTSTEGGHYSRPLVRRPSSSSSVVCRLSSVVVVDVSIVVVTSVTITVVVEKDKYRLHQGRYRCLHSLLIFTIVSSVLVLSRCTYYPVPVVTVIVVVLVAIIIAIVIVVVIIVVILVIVVCCGVTIFVI